MKVVTIVGARPQFVKAAAFAAAVRGTDVDHVLVHTGQHYDAEMSSAFFRPGWLDEPDVNLGVGSGSHARQTAEMLVGIEGVLVDLRPDVVLLYGDTNSTLAGALAAAKLHLPIAHVEAGLRSYRRTMPEEVNRVVTDRLSTYLFCPSEAAAANCRAEGITEGVEVVGDVMRDALELQRTDLPTNPAAAHGLSAGGYVLATLHRAENTDDPARLAAIIDGLARVGREVAPVVLPLHPRTRALVGADELAGRGIVVLDPQPFAEMLALESEARAIVTDSGGVQKEAFWLGVPCVTTRDETEWVETVEAGWNVVVGADAEAIVAAACAPRPDTPPPDVYGTGDASRRILDTLRRAFA